MDHARSLAEALVPDRSEDYRRFIEVQFKHVLEELGYIRQEGQVASKGTHQRLDKVNGRLDRHDAEIRALQLAQARLDAAHQGNAEGRITPTHEQRRSGDEEILIRMTPKMWAALAGVTSALYVGLTVLVRFLQKAQILP